MKLGAAKRSLPVGYAGVITATPTTSRQIRFQATDSAILWPMRRIVFAAVPPIQILDLTARSKFSPVAGIWRGTGFNRFGRRSGEFKLRLTLCEAKDYRRLRGPVDTLLVPGGDGAEQFLCSADFLRWLARMSTRVRRIGSICTGAFLLGRFRARGSGMRR
jgi:transcriptional regulator GlxA family with amidase domain